MSTKCEKCMDYGIAIVKKSCNSYEYEFAFICDCWAGIGRKEKYPNIKNKDSVIYFKKF